MTRKRAHRSAAESRGRWRLAAALGISVAFHAATVSGILWPDRQPPAAGVVVVDLVGAGEPAALPDAAGPAAGAGDARAHPPAPGAAPAPPVDRAEALVAERDALAARLDAEVRARARLGDRVAALTAEARALADLLGDARRQTARLQQAAADRRAADQAMHDRLLAALRREIAERDVELRRAREGLALSIVDRVLFPSGQATLTTEGLAVIDKVASVLARTAARRILIEGHTDDVPIGPELRARFPTNWELSTARATEVVRQLAARGVPVLALEAVGRADTRPVASNETEAGRRRNRRIEIIVSGPPEPPADLPESRSLGVGRDLDSPGPARPPGGGRRLQLESGALTGGVRAAPRATLERELGRTLPRAAH